MANGEWKEIVSIAPGEFVKAWDKGRLVNREVEAFIPQGKAKVFEVKTGNHCVRATGNHPFLVESGGQHKWVSADALKRGDRIVSLGLMAGGETIIPADAGDSIRRSLKRDNKSGLLGVRQYKGSWRAHIRDGAVMRHLGTFKTKEAASAAYQAERAKTLNPSRFVNADDAWAFGYMLGDGWVTERKTRHGTINLITCVAKCIYADRNERILSWFEDRFGRRPIFKKKFGYYRTEAATAGRFLRSLGFAGKAKTKRVPQWVFTASLELRESFIAGFIAADGYIGKDGRAAVKLCNLDLVEDVKLMAIGCGIHVSNIHTQTRVLQPPHSKSPIVATSHSILFNYLPHEKHGTRRAATEFESAVVRSVTEVGEEEVFDLTVAGNQNFIAEGLVVHNTRWSHDDPVARLIDPKNPYYREAVAKQWTVINIPAIVENEHMAKALGLKVGDALWADRFGLEHLATLKATNERGFSALFMGRPTPPEGDFFKRDQIHGYTIDELPENGTNYLAGDFAVSKTQTADQTCAGKWTVGPDDTLYLRPDILWDRVDSGQWVEWLIDGAVSTSALTLFAEKGVIDKAVGPFLAKRMREREKYFHVNALPSAGNKGACAAAIRDRMAMGKVRFPKFASWWPRAEEAILKFGEEGGPDDDFVDMLGCVGRGLTKQLVGRENDAPTNVVRPKSGTRAWFRWCREHEKAADKKSKALAGW